MPGLRVLVGVGQLSWPKLQTRALFCRPFSQLPASTERKSCLKSHLIDLDLRQHQDAIESLGVKTVKDLSLLEDADLTSKDIPLVEARKILKQGWEDDKKAKPLSAAQEAIVYLNNFGLFRADRSYKQIMVSSILGGSFLSFGASMFVLLGGGTPVLQSSLPGLHAVASALIFPIGLSTIVLTSTDLLTSSMMYATLPFASEDGRKTNSEKMENLAKLWGTNFVGNFIGCAGIAFLVSSMFIHDPFNSFVQAIAIKKTSYLANGTMLTAFTKAVGANWLVCLAVFQATTANTSPGKMAALWLPITTFVALGMEHSVANMFFVPLAMFCGADIPMTDFLIGNLVPVCLGNAVGGGVFVSLLHWHYLMKK